VDQLPATLHGLGALPGYHARWHGGAGGYSGVALLLKKSAFADARWEHPAFDMETRIVTATVGDVVFASAYCPNGGKDYDAKIAFFTAMVPWAKELAQSGKKLVLSGDINIALTDRDVHPSQRKADVIGQREEERALFRALLEDGKLVDVGRALAPDDDRMFSWWPYWKAARQRNLGWRIDYVLAAEGLASAPKAGGVRREFGTSDHAPVVVELG
jgi:exodeoxyribonuclease-3